MASIQKHSSIVIRACNKAIKSLNGKTKIDKKRYQEARAEQLESRSMSEVRHFDEFISEHIKIDQIKKLAHCSEYVTIDHNDFALIGEFLTTPTEPTP